MKKCTCIDIAMQKDIWSAEIDSELPCCAESDSHEY